MNHDNQFETFDKEGRLFLPEEAGAFKDRPWNPHPSFEGVELKHLITARESGGVFSYHLVRVAPGQAIGTHVHQTQLETHEVLDGSGVCSAAGRELPYAPGTIAVLPEGMPHKVTAGPEGLCLFAKFFPALL